MHSDELPSFEQLHRQRIEHAGQLTKPKRQHEYKAGTAAPRDRQIVRLATVHGRVFRTGASRR